MLNTKKKKEKKIQRTIQTKRQNELKNRLYVYYNGIAHTRTVKIFKLRLDAFAFHGNDPEAH